MDTFNRDAHYSRGDHDIDMIVKRRETARLHRRLEKVQLPRPT